VVLNRVVPKRDLAPLEIFSGFPDGALDQFLSFMRPRTFRRGEALVKQGDPSPSLHVILAGSVSIRKSGDLRALAQLGPGDIVGEVGLLTRSSRTATATAQEETETVEISAGGVEAMLKAFPEAMEALMQTFSRRLDALSN
jgi:CRP-like cAMP-binding protein